MTFGLNLIKLAVLLCKLYSRAIIIAFSKPSLIEKHGIFLYSSKLTQNTNLNYKRKTHGV
jgi:hypothetical protein